MKCIPFFSRHVQTACWLASTILLFSACHKATEFEYIDEDIDDPVSGETNVTVTDENGNETTLASGSTIGVYVVGTDGSVTYQQVEVDESGNAALPTSDQGGQMIAYSPYQEEWGDDAIVSNPVFTVQTAQITEGKYNASDLIVGVTSLDNSEAQTRATGPTMTFIHMMAKVAIHIVDETGRVDFSRIQAELLNMHTSAQVDLLHQTVTTIETDRVNIPMFSEMTTDWRLSSYAIVPPQAVADGTLFYAVTLYGTRQSYPIPEAAMLESGKTFTINMRLTEHGLMPDGWYITDWSDEGERDIDIKL